MSKENTRASLPFRLTVIAALNILLAWGMTQHLSEYFYVVGGWSAYIIIGALLTLMNIFVRPILNVITAPLRLFAGLFAMVIVHGGFIQLVHTMVLNMDPNMIQIEIRGGLWGWMMVAGVLGFANWIEHHIFK